MPWLRLYLFLPHWNDLEVSTQHKRVDCIETLTAMVLATALRRLPNDGRKGSGSQLRLPRIITFTIIIGRLPSGICLRSWLLAWAPPCIHTGTDRQKWNYLEERTFALQYVLYPKYFLVCLFACLSERYAGSDIELANSLLQGQKQEFASLSQTDRPTTQEQEEYKIWFSHFPWGPLTTFCLCSWFVGTNEEGPCQL